MSSLVIPARTPLATALREPNLLVPNKKPVGSVILKEGYNARDIFLLNNSLKSEVSRSNIELSGAEWSVGEYGVCLSCTGTDYAYMTGYSEPSSGELTYCFDAKITSYVNGGGLFSANNENEPQDNYTFCLVKTDNTNLRLYVNSSYRIVATGYNVAGNIIRSVISYNGTTWQWWINGKKIGQYTGAIRTGTNASPETLYLSTGYNAAVPAEWYKVEVFDYALPDAECLRRTADSYVWYTPANDAPFLFPAASSALTITADFVDSTASIFQPTLEAGAGTLTADYLNTSAAIYQPDLLAASSDLTADFVDSAASIFQPSLLAGAADLTADFVDSTATIPQPSLVASDATITADYIDSAASIFQPTLGAGAATLVADFVDSTASVYQPVLGGVATLSADFIDSTATISQPNLTGASTVTADFVDSTATIYQPTLGAGAATIVADFVNSTASIFIPSLSGPQTLTAGFVDSTAAIYSPTLADSTAIWTAISEASTTWTEISDTSTTWTEI